ncbi:MAG: 30S ribosomal protein S27ae [Nanoarchaeota archaeon]
MAKIKRKTKKTSIRYKLYDGIKRKNKFCPKCGEGIFLAQHKDRLVCGKCSYMEKLSKN